MRFLALSLLFASMACKTTGNNRDASTLAGDPPPNNEKRGEFHLDGYKETLLVSGELPKVEGQEQGQAKHRLALVTFGPKAEIKVLAKNLADSPDVGVSRFGRFYVHADGMLLVIDGKSGKIEKEIPLLNVKSLVAIGKDTLIVAFERDPGWDDSEEAKKRYAPEEKLLRLTKIDLNKPKSLIELDLKGKTTGTQLESITLIDDQLYVTASTSGKGATAELLLVDRDLKGVVKTLDLGKLNSPHFAPAYHKRSGILYVPGSPERPRGKGATVAVNLKTMTVDSSLSFSPATFNGAIAISNNLQTAIHLQHTSTPVSSTHVAFQTMAENGEMKGVGGPTVFDLFESRDNFDLNESESLFTLANNCAVGYCTVGKGINLVDMKKGIYLPKIFDEVLTLVPSFARFLKN